MTATAISLNSASLNGGLDRMQYCNNVFMEDVEMMEAQQAAIERDPERALIDINVDAPALAMRSLVAGRIAAENGEAAP